MWHTNSKIGFDDRLLILIVIPLASFTIPVVFFGLRFERPPYFTWNAYLTTFIISTVVWLGNRYIMIWTRSRYPQFEAVKKDYWFSRW